MDTAESPSALPWQPYFDSRISVHCPARSITFSVYTAGTTGPIVLCLAGGGYSGLSWALVAQILKPTCRVVAPDLRGHGLTTSSDEADLSAATLSADVIALWREMFTFSSPIDNISPSLSTLPPPPTIILGHSMGGAIAVHSASIKNGGITSLQGIAVLDAVEGPALASLPYMRAVLDRRPVSFPDPAAAIKWALDSGTSRNKEAAEISVPAMLVGKLQGGKPARVVDSRGKNSDTSTPLGSSGRPPIMPPSTLRSILESDVSEDGIVESATGNLDKNNNNGSMKGKEEEEAAAAKEQEPRNRRSEEVVWVWRTPLEESSKHWEGWYRGLSEAFLALPIPKILILAGTDRLDKTLMIGQMQGKFQLVLLPRAGHAVHEDEPDAVAETVLGFIKRFKVGVPVPTRSSLP